MPSDITNDFNQKEMKCLNRIIKSRKNDNAVLFAIIMIIVLLICANIWIIFDIARVNNLSLKEIISISDYHRFPRQFYPYELFMLQKVESLKWNTLLLTVVILFFCGMKKYKNLLVKCWNKLQNR